MAEWHRVCTVDQLEEGAPLGARVGARCVAIFRVGERFHATSDMCTHEEAYLSEGFQAGEIIECPLHQAQFRVTDGKCLSAPAERDLETFDVKVEGNEIFVRF